MTRRADMSRTKSTSVSHVVGGAMALLIAGGIGSGMTVTTWTAGQDTTKAAPASTQKLAITFSSKPSPPVTGENAFEVTVKDAKGAPIVDADVTVAFRMAPMPSMNMPEMKNEMKLKSAAGGIYRGTGQVTMGGKWDVTVHVKQGGKEIGKKTFAVTAK
jgi:nitrogen fixation protein FixH